MSSGIGFVIRFEGDQAIIRKKDYSIVTIPKNRLPANLKEGDFVVELLQTHEYKVDYALTELRLRELRRMTDCFVD
ncbi:MAG: DUF3006 domain-containing protein [Clostridiaceae bacterium]|nr:DUF3006 domain-containing protein [Clostridiaceae bacterium]